MTEKFRLTEAQYSALECSGLLLDVDDNFSLEDLTDDEKVLRAAISGRTLTVDDDTYEAIARAINELSNAEDNAAGEQRNEMAIYAKRASRALSNLFIKVTRRDCENAGVV